MGNKTSSTRTASSSSTTAAGHTEPRANHYDSMPRSPASPYLPTFVDSPESYNTSNTPALAGPPYGHARLHTETEAYEISLPVNRRHVRKLSELIDPTHLSASDDYVKSPSGNLLGHADFCAREDRPLSLRERQERIRQQLNTGAQAAYPVSGTSSAKPSPTDSKFSMFDIPESDEGTPSVIREKYTQKKKGGCWCF